MMKHYFLLVLSLFVMAAIHNVVAETLAPEEIKGARTISTDTAKLFLRRGYPFVDVRGQSDFDKGHLPGAFHLSVKSVDFTVENLSKIATKDAAIIFYCNGVACMGSAIATEKAVQWGWRNVFYYREGYKGWQEVETEY